MLGVGVGVRVSVSITVRFSVRARATGTVRVGISLDNVDHTTVRSVGVGSRLSIRIGHWELGLGLQLGLELGLHRSAAWSYRPSPATAPG